MSIKRHDPDQIATLPRQIEVVRLTPWFGPLLMPATDFGFEGIHRESDPFERTQPGIFLTFAQFEFPIRSIWVSC